MLKSASELLSNDMVYCGLARDNHNHDDDDDDDDDDDQDSNEVFVGVDDARSVVKLSENNINTIEMYINTHSLLININVTNCH